MDDLRYAERAACVTQAPDEHGGRLLRIGVPRAAGEGRRGEHGGKRKKRDERDPALTSHCHEPTPGNGGSLAALVELPVEAVDQRRHRLEALGDHAEAVLAEVLRFDLERLCERLDDIV